MAFLKRLLRHLAVVALMLGIILPAMGVLWLLANWLGFVAGMIVWCAVFIVAACALGAWTEGPPP